MTATMHDTVAGFSREAVEELSRRKNEAQWVRDRRLAAWDRYEELSMPQRNEEEWRRTDFRALKLEKLRPFGALTS